MGPNLLLYALFLSGFGQIQGSSAVTPVFVQRGKDVLLNFKTDDDLQKYFVVSWIFSVDITIVTSVPQKEPIISPGYTGRIEFSVKNYSLKLKNLQDADEGVYTVRMIGTHRELRAQYNVRVQDPVSPVDLTVDAVSKSSDSCNLTVTCRTQDSLISSTFRCDTKSCSEEGERSEVITSDAFLHVYLVNDSIICNHSNQVSWTKDIKMIEPLCLPSTGTPKQGSATVYVLVVILILIFIIIIAAVLCVRHRQKNKSENIENTVYDVPQVNESHTNDTSGVSPMSTYCLVGPHNGCTGSTKRGDNILPESLYAQVQRSAKS